MPSDEVGHGMRGVLGGLCLGTFACFANTTAFNVALPDVSASLGAGIAAQQWMVSAYNLTFASSMLPAGFLGDRWGLKRLLLLGAVVMAAASALGLASPCAGALIAARGLMGAGAGLYVPMSLALIRRMFGPAGRVGALAKRSAAMAAGAPAGLVLGGLLADAAGWRSIFAFDVAAFAVTGLLNARLAPTGTAAQDGAARRRPPLLSALLVLAGLSLLSMGLVNAQDGPVPASVVPAVAGAAVLVLFALRDAKSPNPLASLGLLRRRPFAGASAALLALNMATFGALFILPSYFGDALGAGTFMGAVMLAPMVGGALAGTAIADRAARGMGGRRASAAALAAIALGLAAMAASTRAAGLPLMAAGQVICGIGMGAGLPAMQGWGMGHVPARDSGGGSALLSTFQQVGALLGTGLLGSAASGAYAAACAGTPAAGYASISLACAAADALDGEGGLAVREAAGAAYADAVMVSLAVAAAVLLAVSVAVARAGGVECGRGEIMADGDRREDARGTSERAVRAREAWQGERLRSTRAVLRACGISLIAERGYDETTAQDIARAAGVSTMTFFRHFPSKEDVVLGLPSDGEAARAAKRAADSLPEGTSPPAAARAALDAAAGELGETGLSAVALRLDIVNGNPSLLRALYAKIPLWTETVMANLPRPLRGDGGFDARLVAAAAVTCWVEIALEWSRRGGTGADAALLAAVADEADGLMSSMFTASPSA